MRQIWAVSWICDCVHFLLSDIKTDPLSYNPSPFPTPILDEVLKRNKPARNGGMCLEALWSSNINYKNNNLAERQIWFSLTRPSASVYPTKRPNYQPRCDEVSPGPLIHPRFQHLSHNEPWSKINSWQYWNSNAERALSNKMNGDRADCHCYSFARI